MCCRLEEQKAVMKKPEEALNEMMPIDVFEEGKVCSCWCSAGVCVCVAFVCV